MKLKFNEPCINVVEGWNASPGDIAEVKDEAEAKRYIAAGIAEASDGKPTASTFDATLNEAQMKADREVAARAARKKAAERAEAPDDSEKAVETESAKKKKK